MKRLSIISIITAAVAFGFASCADEVEEFKKGAPDKDDCYGVYFPAQKTNVILDPSDPTVDTIIVARTKTDGAITVPFTFKGDSVFTVSELTFEDGQTESYIALAFDSAKVGVTYKCSIAFNDPKYASQYTSNAIAVDFAVTREKWNSLGMAAYTDYWFFNDPFEVEILQNDNNPDKYRLIDAYKGIDAALAKEGYTILEPTSVIEFQVLRPGDVYAKVTISEDGEGLVAYPIIHTGYYSSSNKDEVCVLHPSNFTSFDTEESWAYNKVLQFQDEKKKELPAGVQFAPIYYLLSAGGGWNYAESDATPSDGGIVFVFPGAVLTDYSLKIKSGFADQGKQDVEFIFGTDVAYAEFATFDGVLNSTKIDEKAAAIVAGKDSTVVKVDSTSVLTLSFPATGQYTLVAVAYDADSVAQTIESAILNFVAATDSIPVDVFAELVSTKKYERMGISSDNYLEYTVYGSDLVDVKIGLFQTNKFNAAPDDYIDYVIEGNEEKEIDFTVADSVLEAINDMGYTNVFTGLNPGLSYTLVVVASNGYEQKLALATASTTGDPLPIFMDYDVTDLDDTLPTKSSDFDGTYEFFAKVKGASTREKVSKAVEVKALNDSIVYAKGMLAPWASKYEFQDSINFFYEDGVLYTLSTAMDSISEDGYCAVLNYTDGKSLWSFQYDAVLVGGFVDKDNIAFGDTYGIGANGWMITLYWNNWTKSGNLTYIQDMLLSTPGQYDDFLAPARRSSLNQLSAALNAPRTNYVETELGYIRSTIKNFKNSQRIVSCGTDANLASVPEPRSISAKVVAVKALKRDHSLEQLKLINY